MADRAHAWLAAIAVVIGVLASRDGARSAAHRLRRVRLPRQSSQVPQVNQLLPYTKPLPDSLGTGRAMIDSVALRRDPFAMVPTQVAQARPASAPEEQVRPKYGGGAAVASLRHADRWSRSRSNNQ